MKRLNLFFLTSIIICACALLFYLKKGGNRSFQDFDADQMVKVKKQSFAVDVKTIGELEAAHSISISSSLRGEQGKLIYIIPDGVNVDVNEVLIKLDSAPFEEKLTILENKYKEQEAYIASLEKSLDWEKSQAEKDDKTCLFEIEAAELDYNKVLYGDGPLEIARLKGAMQKAHAKFDELKGYSNDLSELQEQGYLNPSELKQAKKKLDEEQELYENAKLQYESYIQHVNPMQIKKAEAALKQAKIKREDTAKVKRHAVEKAAVELEHALRTLEGIKFQCLEAKQELAATEIRAPAKGMAVHREDYRSGQRRKPRLGDVTVRNQVILDLPDLNFMTVRTKVREVDLCKVEIGKKATVEIDAYPQLRLSGTITSIGMLALPELGKPVEEKYFEVRLALDANDKMLRPGMTARVTIHADQISNVLAVPIHTLHFEEKKAWCYVCTPQGVEKKEVITGISNDDWAEIKGGLKEGESVCLTMPIAHS
jgi:HlyD family secretion protein